jgi:hypothetical protein
LNVLSRASVPAFERKYPVFATLKKAVPLAKNEFGFMPQKKALERAEGWNR